MIVLDASAIVDVVIDEPIGVRVARRLLSDDSWRAPDIVDFEVLSAILQGRIDESVAEFALGEFASMTIQRAATIALLHRGFDLRATVPAGDGLYVALAEQLDCTLVTTDGRLARSHGHDAEIELVA